MPTFISYPLPIQTPTGPSPVTSVSPSTPQSDPNGVTTPGLPSSQLELNNFIQQIRTYLRDYPDLNRLIAGVESSNRQIVWAIFDTLDDFNTTPPFTNFDLFNFPGKSLLVRGTVCSLLESIGLLQTRNQLSFSDGGLQVGINDKTPFIQSWLQLLRNSYEEKKMKLKVSYNIESAWNGGVFSEYLFANNFYGDW